MISYTVLETQCDPTRRMSQNTNESIKDNKADVAVMTIALRPERTGEVGSSWPRAQSDKSAVKHQLGAPESHVFSSSKEHLQDHTII